MLSNKFKGLSQNTIKYKAYSMLYTIQYAAYSLQVKIDGMPTCYNFETKLSDADLHEMIDDEYDVLAEDRNTVRTIFPRGDSKAGL